MKRIYFINNISNYVKHGVLALIGNHTKTVPGVTGIGVGVLSTGFMNGPGSGA
ncbi:MAG: hypothetical protein ACLSH6_08185 [Limosilactobacillus pontis]